MSFLGVKQWCPPLYYRAKVNFAIFSMPLREIEVENIQLIIILSITLTKNIF